MHLGALTLDQCQQVSIWRNKELAPYRTPYMLTDKMQKDFYDSVVSDRKSNHRFWSLIETMKSDKSSSTWGKITYEYIKFIGLGGLVDISLENRAAEISLVIDPELRGEGYGEKAVDMILDKAFNYMNLDHVYGECYNCSPSLNFWLKICEKKGVTLYKLPVRKYYNNDYYGSIYFNFTREAV